jgi:hypothetical protein
MSLRHAACALALAAVLIGCHKPDYFPLSTGLSRKFTIRTFWLAGVDTTDAGEYSARLEITDRVRDPALGDYWVTRIDGYPAVPDRYWLQKRTDGVFLLPLDEAGACSKPIRLLAPQPAVGRMWFGNEYREESFEVLSRERVVVPAGAFDGCCKIAVRINAVDWVLFLWLAPGTGIVKWERRTIRDEGGQSRQRVESAELVEPRR